mmetsp:Transcript_38325/g.120180  ORF Transcript_38325/g.120180 Transcript_38325/m.120180 type:complete len:234 (+) Transcript_38325:1873-2574(+)
MGCLRDSSMRSKYLSCAFMGSATRSSPTVSMRRDMAARTCSPPRPRKRRCLSKSAGRSLTASRASGLLLSMSPGRDPSAVRTSQSASTAPWRRFRSRSCALAVRDGRSSPQARAASRGASTPSAREARRRISTSQWFSLRSTRCCTRYSRCSGNWPTKSVSVVKQFAMLPTLKKSSFVRMSMPWGKFCAPWRPTFSWNAADAARRQFTSRSKSVAATMARLSVGMCGRSTWGS